MKLFDTHAHLDFPKLYDRIDEVLKNAKDAGVEYMVAIGASNGIEPNYKAVELAETYANIYCSVGIHPHDAAKVTDEELSVLLDSYGDHPKVVGIGEAGLDYYYKYSPPERQKDVFRQQLIFSKKVNKPIIIHSREADDDCIEILREESVTRGILHCFTASIEMAKALIEELDFYVSFSGIATYKNAKDVLEVSKYIPLDRILVETDAPFLAPVPRRGKTNEPAFVKHTAEYIAKNRDISLESFAEHTYNNSLKVFNIKN